MADFAKLLNSHGFDVFNLLSDIAEGGGEEGECDGVRTVDLAVECHCNIAQQRDDPPTVSIWLNTAANPIDTVPSGENLGIPYSVSVLIPLRRLKTDTQLTVYALFKIVAILPLGNAGHVLVATGEGCGTARVAWRDACVVRMDVGTGSQVNSRIAFD
jgi:hypothetical protein